MNPSDFHAPEAGRVIEVPQGYSAFVPAPLPPKLVYDADVALALSAADAAVSELSGLGRQLPNPHLLIASYVRREAVLSSRIEGTRASLSDLLLDEASAQSGPPPGDVREVRNYVVALDYGIKRLETLPLSLRLVREIHERLMRGVRGDHAAPGEFRRSQNWIGPTGSTAATALYVPPPPHEMKEALADWERFVHERGRVPDLIQCALMHEQFEAIHPFLDGNGRIGRLLITLFLAERGRLSQPLLYLSEFIERHRQEYYERLQRVRSDGDWSGWIAYFLEGVRWTARRALKQASQLTDLREDMRRRLRDRGKALALVDELFVNPYITVARAESILKVTNPTARQIVKRLESEGLLEEVSGRSWGRVYLSKPILKAIEKPPDGN
jgi:Fic family protein